jgi:hypothetical protein
MSVEDRVADATALVPGVSAGVAGFVAFPYCILRSSAHDFLRCDVQVSVNVTLKSSATKIGAFYAPAFCLWNNLHRGSLCSTGEMVMFRV